MPKPQHTQLKRIRSYGDIKNLENQSELKKKYKELQTELKKTKTELEKTKTELKQLENMNMMQKPPLKKILSYENLKKVENQPELEEQYKELQTEIINYQLEDNEEIEKINKDKKAAYIQVKEKLGRMKEKIKEQNENNKKLVNDQNVILSENKKIKDKEKQLESTITSLNDEKNKLKQGIINTAQQINRDILKEKKVIEAAHFTDDEMYKLLQGIKNTHDESQQLLSEMSADIGRMRIENTALNTEKLKLLEALKKKK